MIHCDISWLGRKGKRELSQKSILLQDFRFSMIVLPASLGLYMQFLLY